MKKSIIGILYLIGIVMFVVGIVLLIISIPGGTTTTNSLGGRTTTPGNTSLFVIALLLTILGGFPILAAEIGALINVIRIQNWTWVVILLLLSLVAIPIYIFAGPTPSIPARGEQYASPPPTYQV